MPMSYRVARNLKDVLNGWGLVYDAYLRQNLIRPNPCGIHTVRQAVTNPSIVIVSSTLRGPAHGTLSAYHDGDDGLPLDSVYQHELDALRAQGRQLVEIGLFADRRETVHRSLDALLELMRWTTWFAVHGGATDAVIGVHPRHADFYARVLGFDVMGPTRTYSIVNGAPVTLLRLDWHRRTQEAMQQGRGLRGLRWILNNPLGSLDFAGRFDGFSKAAENTRIGRFLRHHAQPTYNQPAVHVQAA